MTFRLPESPEMRKFGTAMGVLVTVLYLIGSGFFSTPLPLYLVLGIVSLYLLFRLGRTLFAGTGLPLSEWLATFLVGAAAAAATALMLPGGSHDPMNRAFLTGAVTGLSFFAAFAGSAFGWHYIKVCGETEQGWRWRWMFAGWVLAVGSWVGLFAYYAAKAK